MKKKLLMVLVFTCILLSGCGKETEQSILKKLKEKVEDTQAYQVTGDLCIYSNEDEYAYEVTVSYQKENQFRVLLKNKTNNHEQIILRNEDGVYILTPSLNKSFKFQSDWPYNSSQSYILQPLLEDMENEEEREFKKTDDGYEWITKVNYVSNTKLVNQKIVLDKNLNFKTVEVYDETGAVSISMKFDKIDYKAKFDDHYFDLNNNMEVARENVDTDEEVSNMDDIIYPMYIPKNTSLESQDKVEKEVGERVILTFAGESPFVFIQETSPVSEEMSVLPVDGEPILLASGIGALTDSSITWIEDNIEYYITTTDLTEEEMLEVVNSVSVMPIGK